MSNPFDESEDEYGDFHTAPTENITTYIGDKHNSKTNDYYDIQVSQSLNSLSLQIRRI